MRDLSAPVDAEVVDVDVVLTDLLVPDLFDRVAYCFHWHYRVHIMALSKIMIMS